MDEFFDGSAFPFELAAKDRMRFSRCVTCCLRSSRSAFEAALSLLPFGSSR